jgi:hypothetical protein
MKNRSKRIMRDVVAVIRQAGVRPELIYAYEQTGFLLTEAGYKNLSPEDRAEYDAAIAEYMARGQEK